MKRFIYSLLIMAFPALLLASDNEFTYVKNTLATEFSQLDKVSTYVEETNVSYSDLKNSRILEGNFELTNSISLKPNLSFDEVDWGAFAWGFCCWPVGIFTVLINDDKDQTSKNSFWAGIGTAAITYTVGYIGFYALLVVSLGATGF